MKKFLLFVALIATTTLGAFAQSERGEKSVVIQGGVKSDPSRFMLGLQGRYGIMDHIRIAPSAHFVFPKHKVTGLDIDLNAHYVFDLGMITPDLTAYPLAGLAMQNERYSGYTDVNGNRRGSKSYTDWGFNLGAGVDYGIDSNSFLDFELKYTFSDADSFSVYVGYGFKF